MNNAKFILSKKIVKEQINKLLEHKLKVSYSYKTNSVVGKILQEIYPEINFSIHAKEEIDEIDDKSKIWFFTQAESEEELEKIMGEGIENFVVDNEVDLNKILKVIDGRKINLSLRMKFQEHRVNTGKYFVYGMSSKKISEIVEKIRGNSNISKLGIHLHRKTQNTSEWNIMGEVKDSLSKDILEKIDFINVGGGLPSTYISYTSKVLPYIFSKLDEARIFLEQFGVEMHIEPGRFIAAPCIKLETEIIQIYDNNIIINTTIYNCALDTLLTSSKLLVEGELNSTEEGESYLIKGNSPTRDDIFRYRVKLKNPKIGDKITFLNAGAYNYTTDFFGYTKLKTEIGD